MGPGGGGGQDGGPGAAGRDGEAAQPLDQPCLNLPSPFPRPALAKRAGGGGRTGDLEPLDGMVSCPLPKPALTDGVGGPRTGDLEPLDGMVKRHNHLKIGWFHQHLTELLDLSLNPLEYMFREFPEVRGSALAGQPPANTPKLPVAHTCGARVPGSPAGKHTCACNAWVWAVLVSVPHGVCGAADDCYAGDAHGCEVFRHSMASYNLTVLCQFHLFSVSELKQLGATGDCGRGDAQGCGAFRHLRQDADTANGAAQRRPALARGVCLAGATTAILFRATASSV